MTQKTHKLSFLYEQISIPAKDLIYPGPSEDELNSILQAAMSAPDHGGLIPFRFLVIQEDARSALSEIFEKAARHRGADEATVLKQKKKPLRSPMIIAVVASITDNPCIPEVEQLLCAGIAAQHIQLACKSLGYGSIWLTGENCYDLLVYESLGLNINERIVAFIYIGTPGNPALKKDRADARTITQHWNMPQHTDFAI